MDVCAYISGYVDGEGSFCVSFSPSNRHLIGWEIRPSFSVSQNRDRSEVLYLLADHFGCGSIRPDRSDNTLKYEVRRIQDLVEKVLPHFEHYPLLSSKCRDFELFKAVCLTMQQGDHLTKAGFYKIVDLAFQMNPSGRRKYAREAIKGSAVFSK